MEQIRIKNKEFPIHAIDLAVGAEIELAISYFDALGKIVIMLLNYLLSVILDPN